MTIELIYDSDCPNVSAARAQLLRALVRTGLPVRWREWDRLSPHSPSHVRTYGSPTILLNGKDILGDAPSGGAELYPRGDGGLAGVPEVREIAEALFEARGAEPRAERLVSRPVCRGMLALLPAIGVALLPKLTCPACWPAYAGVFERAWYGVLQLHAVFAAADGFVSAGVRCHFVFSDAAARACRAAGRRNGQRSHCGRGQVRLGLRRRDVWRSGNPCGRVALERFAHPENALFRLRQWRRQKKPLTLHQGAGRRVRVERR
jgi:hypothetical protein